LVFEPKSTDSITNSSKNQFIGLSHNLLHRLISLLPIIDQLFLLPLATFLIGHLRLSLPKLPLSLPQSTLLLLLFPQLTLSQLLIFPQIPLFLHLSNNHIPPKMLSITDRIWLLLRILLIKLLRLTPMFLSS